MTAPQIVTAEQVRDACEAARHHPVYFTAPVEPTGDVWRERDRVYALLAAFGIDVEKHAEGSISRDQLIDARRAEVYNVMVDHPVWATVVDGQSDEAQFSRLFDAVCNAAGLPAAVTP